jgi:hypothetical protein
MKYSEPKALCTKKERNERGCSSGWRNDSQKTPPTESFNEQKYDGDGGRRAEGEGEVPDSEEQEATRWAR